MKLPKILFALMAMLLVGAACTTKTDLQPGSVYGSDVVLFNYEKVAPGAFSALDAFVTWEYNNRQALLKYPEIKAAADTVRAQAKQWKATVVSLHDAYVANPTPANGSALTQELAVLQSALNSAQTYMTEHKTT